MPKNLRRLALILCLVLITLTGCNNNSSGGGAAATGDGGEPGASTSGDKDSLVIGLGSDVTAMDPLRINDTVTMSLLSNIYEPLVRQRADSSIVPALAESWDISEDGLEYTFHLRSGVTFHNGEPVTAEDVKFSVEAAVESSYSGPYISFLDHCEVIDDSTVKIVLEYAYSPFLALCATYTNVMKESFYEDDGVSMSKEPIGCGPYQFVSWTQGDKVELVAFEDYYAGPAPIKNVTYKILTNTTTAAIALETGELDMYLAIAETDIDTLSANNNLIIDQKPSSSFFYLGLNVESDVFSDVRVRQAVAKAVNRENLVLGVLDGNAIAARSFVAEGLPGYDAGFDPLPYDPDGAKALLEEAGYGDGLNVTIIIPEARSEHAQMIQADLKQIGIELKIEILETGAFWDDVEYGNYEMMMMGWSYVVMDPDVGYYSLYQSEEITAGNYVRYANDRVDELLEEGRVSSDAARRDEIYKEIETIVMTDAPYVPLYWRYTTIGYDKNLQGVEIPPIAMYFVYDYNWA